MEDSVRPGFPQPPGPRSGRSRTLAGLGDEVRCPQSALPENSAVTSSSWQRESCSFGAEEEPARSGHFTEEARKAPRGALIPAEVPEWKPEPRWPLREKGSWMRGAGSPPRGCGPGCVRAPSLADATCCHPTLPHALHPCCSLLSPSRSVSKWDRVSVNTVLYCHLNGKLEPRQSQTPQGQQNLPAVPCHRLPCHLPHTAWARLTWPASSTSTSWDSIIRLAGGGVALSWPGSSSRQHLPSGP